MLLRKRTIKTKKCSYDEKRIVEKNSVEEKKRGEGISLIVEQKVKGVENSDGKVK